MGNCCAQPELDEYGTSFEAIGPPWGYKMEMVVPGAEISAWNHNTQWAPTSPQSVDRNLYHNEWSPANNPHTEPHTNHSVPVGSPVSGSVRRDLPNPSYNAWDTPYVGAHPTTQTTRRSYYDSSPITSPSQKRYFKPEAIPSRTYPVNEDQELVPQVVREALPDPIKAYFHVPSFPTYNQNESTRTQNVDNQNPGPPKQNIRVCTCRDKKCTWENCPSLQLMAQLHPPITNEMDIVDDGPPLRLTPLPPKPKSAATQWVPNFTPLLQVNSELVTTNRPKPPAPKAVAIPMPGNISPRQPPQPQVGIPSSASVSIHPTQSAPFIQTMSTPSINQTFSTPNISTQPAHSALSKKSSLSSVGIYDHPAKKLTIVAPQETTAASPPDSPIQGSPRDDSQPHTPVVAFSWLKPGASLPFNEEDHDSEHFQNIPKI